MSEKKVIRDFGNEWNIYNQNKLDKKEQKIIFDQYFSIFPHNKLNKSSIGADFGSGSGRWSEMIYNKVALIYCVEPSKAIEVAKKKFSKDSSVIFLNEKIQECSIKNSSLDFAFSLGVLHHVEDIDSCLKIIISKLKVGSPFLMYVYYDFENKNFLYRLIWKLSNLFRIIISKLPFKIKLIITFMIGLFVYYPLALLSRVLTKYNVSCKNIPLNYYKDKSFYTMKTDALDRFGTKIEKRFSKKKIYQILIKAGFIDIKFSEKAPFWCVCGYKK